MAGGIGLVRPQVAVHGQDVAGSLYLLNDGAKMTAPTRSDVDRTAAFLKRQTADGLIKKYGDVFKRLCQLEPQRQLPV